MSKYMQLTVTVRSYYEKNLEQAYPKLARNLKNIDDESGGAESFSLWTSWDNWINFFMPSRVRSSERCFSRREYKLLNLHKSIEENICRLESCPG